MLKAVDFLMNDAKEVTFMNFALKQAKLDAAKRMAGERRVVSSDDSIFSSNKSATEFDEQEFDRKLRERNGP